MKFITNEQVEKILLEDPHEYVNYIHRRIHEIRTSDRVWLKDKIIYEDPFNSWGDIRPMTCFTNKVKVVKVIATNPYRQNNPSVSVGTTVVLDKDENYPTHIIDAEAMSGIRTAAMVAWAISAGCLYPVNSILIVGKGRVGSYIRQLVDGCFDFTNISMLDTDWQTAKKMTYDQDLVITATNSIVPFITKDNCKAKYVISVGADTHYNHEIDSSYLENKRVWVDIPEASQVGDLAYSSVKPIGTMMDMDEHSYMEVFISVGSALMDALTVEYLLGY